MQADFSLFDRHGQLVLTVEVRNTVGTTRGWAAEMRAHLLANTDYPVAPYFLLALPDRFCLWKQTMRSAGKRSPDFVVDAVPLLRHYYEPLGYTTGELSWNGFELVVSFWLNALVEMELPAEGLPRHLEWLEKSGLLQAAKGARVAVASEFA